MEYLTNWADTLINSDKDIQPKDWPDIGGKAQGLVWLNRVGTRVPAFWVIKGKEIFSWLQQRYPSFATSKSDVQLEILESVQLPLSKWIESKLTDLPLGNFAVRSSGQMEDSNQNSFAGVYESYLEIRTRHEVAEKVCLVFKSAFSERSQKYLSMRKMENRTQGISIIVQEMVDAVFSGVCFSLNVKTGRTDECWISTTTGLGEALVSGAVEGCDFVLNGQEEIVPQSDSGASAFFSQVSHRLVLKKVGVIAKDLAHAYGKPVDIEWAYDGKDVWLVQIRPITSRNFSVATDRMVFDNSNIQESYCGITSPLTLSYASEAYRKVYQKLMEFLLVDETEIARNQVHLENMLGYVSGRIYYNINSWYAALSLLPSFKKRKAEMETMMGLESPVEFVMDQSGRKGLDKLKHSFTMFKVIMKLVYLQLRIDSVAQEFDDWFWRLYRQAKTIPLGEKSASEIVRIIKYYQDRFLEKWAVPVLNDTLVMMNMGRLQRLLDQFGAGEGVKSLIYGSEIESIKPTLRLKELAQNVCKDESLFVTISECTSRELPFLVGTFFPEFKLVVDDFIDLYGDRTMGELKLETITMRQDPSLFYDLLKNFVHSYAKSAAKDINQTHSHSKSAILEIQGKMNFWQRLVFKRVLKSTVTTVAYREKMRLQRTRNYGLMREFYLALGEKWTQSCVLNDPRDIFFLTLNEIFEMNFGRNVTRSYKNLVQLRKQEQNEYQKESPKNQVHLPVPAGKGIADQGAESAIVDVARQEHWSGLACSQGEIEGEIVVVESSSDTKNIQGKILVALRTDPGWTPLFALVKGVIIERGSILSHSAVISREMGIPAVVNIPAITKQLKTGDRVRLDGNSGRVTRI